MPIDCDLDAVQAISTSTTHSAFLVRNAIRAASVIVPLALVLSSTNARSGGVDGDDASISTNA